MVDCKRVIKARRFPGALIGSLLMLVSLRDALAYRPFDATDADVVEAGEIEFELGPLGYLREGDEEFSVAPDVVVNFGLTDRWEVVLEGQHRIRHGARRGESRYQLTDTGLFLKGMLREGVVQKQSGPSVALEIGALLPTVNDESGVGGAALLIASYRWSSVTVHFNGEVALARTGDVEVFAGTIVEGPEAWSVRPVLEIFVEGEAGRSPAVRSLLAGAIWETTDALAFDFGARVARSEGDTTYELRAGLTWAFVLREKRR